MAKQSSRARPARRPELVHSSSGSSVRPDARIQSETGSAASGHAVYPDSVVYLWALDLFRVTASRTRVFNMTAPTWVGLGGYREDC